MLGLKVNETGDNQDDWQVVLNRKKLKSFPKKKYAKNEPPSNRQMKYSSHNIHNLPINSLKVNNVKGFAILIKVVEENIKNFLNPKVNRTELWQKIKQEAMSQGYSCRTQTCVKSAFGGQMGIYVRIIQFIKDKEEAEKLFNLFTLFHELDLSPFLNAQKWQRIIRDRNRLNSSNFNSNYLEHKNSLASNKPFLLNHQNSNNLSLTVPISHSTFGNFLNHSKSSLSLSSSTDFNSPQSHYVSQSKVTTSSDILQPQSSLFSNSFSSIYFDYSVFDSNFPILNFECSLKLINCVRQHMSDFCSLLVNESNYTRKSNEIWCKISYEWASSIHSNNFFDPSLVQLSFKSLFDHYVNILYTVDSCSDARQVWPLFDTFFNQYWTPMLTKDEADIYLNGREKISNKRVS